METSVNKRLVVHSHLNSLDNLLYLKGFIVGVICWDTLGDTRYSLLSFFYPLSLSSSDTCKTMVAQF